MYMLLENTYRTSFQKFEKKSDWSFVFVFESTNVPEFISLTYRLHTTYIPLTYRLRITSHSYSKMSQATNFAFTQEGFQAVVERMLALERLVRAKATTVSPPPGVYIAQDRNRSYSSESNNSLSSLEEFTGDSSGFTQMPCKPEYGKKVIICSALLDGWLIHGSTYDYKDTIKENGGKWFGKCKGWALNDKSTVAHILKEITLPKKLEKVKNTFQNLGLRFYKPVEKTEQKPMTDEAIQEVNASVDNFLEDTNDGDTGGGATKHSTCLIEESDDDSFQDDENDDESIGITD